MQDRSESIGELLAALIAARGAISPVPKRRVARIPGRPEYHYADLQDILGAIDPALTANGIAHVSQRVLSEGNLYLKTTLQHVKSGQWIASFYPFTSAATPQAHGSESTYGTRYNLGGLLHLPLDDDDDAQAAMQKQKQQTSRPTAPKQQNTPISTNGVAASRAGGESPPTNLKPAGTGYIIPFGKFKDKPIGQVPLNQLAHYAAWLREDAQKKGKPPTQNVSEFLSIVEKLTHG